MVWKEPPASPDWEDRLALRDALMRLFELLPDVEMELKDWIPAARSAIKDALAVFGTLEIRPSDKMKVTKATADVRAADAFGRRSGAPLEALTVHSVKGETHEGVLLVGARTKNHDHGAQWLESPHSAHQPEEVRVAYVALTRAAKSCMVALPSGDPRDDRRVREPRFCAPRYRSIEMCVVQETGTASVRLGGC